MDTKREVGSAWRGGWSVFDLKFRERKMHASDDTPLNQNRRREINRARKHDGMETEAKNGIGSTDAIRIDGKGTWNQEMESENGIGIRRWDRNGKTHQDPNEKKDGNN